MFRFYLSWFGSFGIDPCILLRVFRFGIAFCICVNLRYSRTTDRRERVFQITGEKRGADPMAEIGSNFRQREDYGDSFECFFWRNQAFPLFVAVDAVSICVVSLL